MSLIIALLISGLVIDLGGGPNHERIGFRVSDKLNMDLTSLYVIHQYWRNPGAMNRAHFVSDLDTDRFLAWINVLVPAAFAYQGMDVVAV